MSRQSPAVTRRWQATLIVSVFAAAVAGAALAGWWYARESSPHQGPVVLISVNGLARNALPASGDSGASPSIDALAADAVVFDRAYTHSPLMLPAYASLMAGQLPFEHGVRDEAGFTLNESTRSLAELLRNRGFETGASVSSFLLRRESGMAQGFSFFDSELPETPPGVTPAIERDGAETMDAAAKWLRSRRGHRYFLFVQVDDAAAETTVSQIVTELKDRDLYDQATILMTADGGASSSDVSLNDGSLQVPLLVKQPGSEGAGRHVAVPVQHIDILPTVLDLVRAPIPSGLRGRSLRDVLGGDAITLPDQPIYAESLAGRFRFGATGTFALINSRHRYVRDDREELVELEPETAASSSSEAPDEAERMRTELDRLLEGYPVGAPAQVPDEDEERFAALGYLGGAPLTETTPTPMTADEEAAVAQLHRSAALFVAHKQYAAAIDRLREITRVHPLMALVQYQAGTLLQRSGRLAEAENTFRAVATIEPDSPYVQIALADVLLRLGRDQDASDRAALAVALAEHQDGPARASAHGAAAMVAVAREQGERAREHAEAAERDDPEMPMTSYVTGRLAYAQGEYESALTSFEATARALSENDRVLEGVQWYLGDTLARLNREADAEKAFREELHAFPRQIRAYSSLAMLYHAASRPDEVKETLDTLVVAVPTPEGYDAAARLWVTVGDPTFAAALRTDARTRFRGDPSLVLFQRRQ